MTPDITCCGIDLAAPPFSVTTGDPLAGPANTAAINTAITQFSGTRARLVLPAGDIYLDQANGHDNWSLKFPAGTSDLALVGHGMFATRLIIQGAGDSGEWHGILVDGAVRIELAEFGIQAGVIQHPDPGDQNHLISIYCSAGVTRDIVGHHLFFGQAIGDGLRIFGDAAPVTNIRFTDFIMRMAGIGGGARSGVAIQRGWNGLELGNFSIDGVRNSPIDMEPGPATMTHLNIHDGLIDQSHGQSDVAFSIGGVSHGGRAQHIRVSDVTVLEGVMFVLSTDDLVITNLTVLATARTGAPLLRVRQVNNDLCLRGVHLARLTGGLDGNVLDIENSGNASTIDGGVFIQGTAGYPLAFDHTRSLRIRGAQIQYTGPSAATYDAILVNSKTGDADNLQIDDVQVTCSTGQLRSAVCVAARPGNSLTNVRVTGVQCAGSAASGARFSYHPDAVADRTPLMTGIDNRPGEVWRQVNQNDNPITTIYPVISGNPGGVCEMVGQAPPEGAVTAIPGTTYTFENGDATARYYKSTGTGNTGWSPPLTVP